MLRKSHILFLLFVFGFALCLTNGFALPEVVLEGDFEFPMPDGALDIQGDAEYQKVPDRIIGTADFEKLRDFPRESQDYQLGTKVGWFAIRNRSDSGYLTCTGFLVGPDLFMTNHHCIHDEDGLLPLAGALVFMNYYQEPEVDRRRGGLSAFVSGVLRMDEDKDYALLRLSRPIGYIYGWLELDTTSSVDSSQRVKLISHPDGRSKEIVRHNTEILDIPAGHPISDIPSALAYLADTQGGASGSPVFLRDGTGVIAIHHSAWNFRGAPHFNAGTLMSHIVPEIQQWLPGYTPPLLPPPNPPPGQVAANMYWTDTGTGWVQRANLDGTDVKNLAAGLASPTDIAVDLTGGKMYWTDAGTGQIQCASLDGSNQQNLVFGLVSPSGIALDVAGNKVYWTDTGTGQIQRANLDGSNVEGLAWGLTSPTDIAVDSTGGKIYWTDAGTGQIQCASLDGSNQQNLVFGLVSPSGIALDVAGNKVYWTDTGTGQIQRANLDGSNVEGLAWGLTSPTDIAVDSTGGKIYWTDAGTGQIQCASLDGSNQQNLVFGLVSPRGIAIGIPQPGGTLRFNPSHFPDQTFTVGQAVNLQLPAPAVGTPPYSYTLTPALPAGLHFEFQDFRDAYGVIRGTPTTQMLPGLYTYTGTDIRGASGALRFTITVISAAPTRLDVNSDGQVDVTDLVIVSIFYGTRVPAGTNFPSDVNLDGVVNLLDLTLIAQEIDATEGDANGVPSLGDLEVVLAAVAAALEGAAAAPNGLSDGIAYRNVVAALADARLEEEAPETVLKALQQLLTEMEMAEVPESTALLPNYPNPFNPETWIPYHLATDAVVVLTIYDVRGSLVRALRLGSQPAGVYESRGRAAYWDGKNQLGEKVASGLYFYTLTAGDFTATRKLLIAK